MSRRRSRCRTKAACYLDDISFLVINAETQSPAQDLIRHVGLPEKAAVDTVQIAAAALNKVEYLLTWNCGHIANPAFRRRIEDVLDAAKFRSSVICTPQEILNV
ncbi:MAG TPA: hypothetical protein PKD54_14435 [Pirellulaceae bacterium]|nr:hypothetical protein [Pirellulaceae bacterium]